MKLLSKLFLLGIVFTCSGTFYAQDSLKVLTYNIEGMKPGTLPGFRLAHIIDELKNLDPDIIALQEINQDVNGDGSDNQGLAIANALSAHFGTAYHYYQQFTHLSWDNQFREHIGIVSKYPVEEEGFFQLATGVFPRKIVWNNIDTPLGKINFFSTHLSFNSQAVRLEQAQQIDSYVKEVEENYSAVNSIICGDFNDIPAAPSITFLTENAADIIYFDSYRQANPGSQGYTVPSNSPNARIDYVFQTNSNGSNIASSCIVMDGTFANNLYRSDHLGVMTVFLDNSNATKETNYVQDRKPFKIYETYSNPYRSNSIIEYELFITGFVKVSLLSRSGQEMLMLKNKKLPAGKYQVSFDTSDLRSQLAFLKIEVNGFTEIRKLALH